MSRIFVNERRVSGPAHYSVSLFPRAIGNRGTSLRRRSARS